MQINLAPTMAAGGGLGMLVGILGILKPMIVVLLTRLLTNWSKKIDAFAASRPAVKQAWAFILAALGAIAMGMFGSVDLGVIITTFLGWIGAMNLHNGDKVSQLPSATPLNTPAAKTAST